MTPIFGEGVVFDAPPERRREMLHNQALRDRFMRGHAETISTQVADMVSAWKEAGTVDLLDWFAELTIYTSSACLIGRKFRDQLDVRFARLYHDLEQGTDAIAFVDPYAPIDSFRRRDEARAGLVDLVQGIMNGRAVGPPATDDDRDLLDVLMSITDEDRSPRFSADTVTGMFISMMFAGHHTTSGTAAWTLIELLRHPADLEAVVEELDHLYADGSSVSYQALREIPRLESAIKEALRLHPPLILLLRVAKRDMEVGGFAIAAGKLVGATPAVSNRLPEAFPAAPTPSSRCALPRAPAPKTPTTRGHGSRSERAGIAASVRSFAMMQLKTIFSVLLRDWAFTLAAAAGQLSQRPLEDGRPAPAALRHRISPSRSIRRRLMRIAGDLVLCQGHGVCESEAPGVFAVSKEHRVTILDDAPPAGRRAEVELAVQYCPTHALRIEED